MARVAVQKVVEGRISEAEALWYDTSRWPTWVDGLGHVVKQENGWPAAGGRLVWDSRPGGRGRVIEHVTEYEPRVGQTIDIEDETVRGVQRVSFEALAGERVRVRLALEYAVKRRTPLTPLTDVLFIRRAMRDSLRRTLGRFVLELAADREGSPV